MYKSTLAMAVGTVMLAVWPAQAADLTPREIYERISPAVVMVMAYPAGGTRGSGGTGSIIRSDGLVLTNAHVVIEEATGRPFPRLTVYLKPERVTGDHNTDLARGMKARVVAYSQPLDLALVWLDGVRSTLPVVTLSDSDLTHIGDRVVAIGHPEQGGLWTLTTGTISSEFDNFHGVKGKHVFQTETGLNRGNSGGPLLNQQGQMIGVNTAIARVAADGMPITSISFSLKSAVANQWIGEQRVEAGRSPATMRAAQASDESAPAAAQSPPSSDVPPKPASPAKPVPKTAPVEPASPARPYNLDELLSDRVKAEADLDSMISEMRGRMKGR